MPKIALFKKLLMIASLRPACWLSLLLLTACLGIGCAKKEAPVFPVKGTVTLDGNPLSEGTVYFKTLAEGKVEAMPVKDGKFEGKALEGKRRIEVVAYRQIPVPGEMGGSIQENMIARRYNFESTLTADVGPTSSNEYEFKVTSK
ncbi:hypothetical protein NA78x_004027 [Anatilimnocola sp. NA78]|uniref:hypothetical protein n=1 Tax=Anatilimnocola sp. NA78 TaxID=3415683 RepID=UPI003CE56C32